MARLNSVQLYGCVADIPKITKNAATGFTRGIFHLATIRSTRYSGETFGEKDRILYDWPVILSTDPEVVAKMEKLKQYDIVEISGVFVTRAIKKITYCKSCGAKNTAEGKLTYVLPIFLARRNPASTTYTEKQAVQEVAANRAISNNIHILGNLCNEVSYYKKGSIETSVYQIATDRRYFVKDDDPAVKTDYPVIRSYGKNAKQDSLCLRTGSLILVDGFLHTREFDRKSVCAACGQEYVWKDNTIEIVPYASDYLAGYVDPETAEQERLDKLAEEGDAILKSLSV